MPTCEELIKEMLESAMEDASRALEDSEYCDEYMESVLCIQPLAWEIDTPAVYVAQVQLSWGGPADGFIIEMDRDMEPYQARYYFQDWFDYAERRLYGKNGVAILDLFSELVEMQMSGHEDDYLVNQEDDEEEEDE